MAHRYFHNSYRMLQTRQRASHIAQNRPCSGTEQDPYTNEQGLTGSQQLECLSSDFSTLLSESPYFDMEFKCEDETIKAHRNVISARSNVFSAMLQSNMTEGQTGEIRITGMRPEFFKDFLRYIYTGKLPELTFEIARCFYEAGDYYEVKGLMKPCASFLASNLTPENAVDMLTLADNHSDQNFKEEVLLYIHIKKIPLTLEEAVIVTSARARRF